MQGIGHAEPKLGRNVTTVLIPILGGSQLNRHRASVAEKPEDVGPATRIALRPVDCDIGEMIERKEVVKG